MRTQAVCALVLFVALVPGTQAGGHEACAALVAAEVPRFADAAGTPLAVRLDLPPCAFAALTDVRVWLGNATQQASRIWDGEGWESGNRYVAFTRLPADEQGALIAAIRADPEASQAGLLAGPGSTVWARFRGDGGATMARPLGEVTWTGTDPVGVWADEGPMVQVRDGQDALVAAAPMGFDRDGGLLPADFAWVAVPRGFEAESQPPPGPPARLVAVAPDAWTGGADYLELEAQPGRSLRGLRLTDGEGTLVFPHSQADAGFVVADAAVADAWNGLLPQDVFVWNGIAAGATRVTEIGSFALAQAGDEVRLVYGDLVVDAFVFGDGGPSDGWQGGSAEAASLDGRVYRRDGDGGKAADWVQPRIHRVLQRDHATRWFDAEGPVHAFTCPETCWSEVSARIAAANSTLDVNLYELGLEEAVEALADAARRGVAVRLLLHPRPVAASDAEMAALAGDVALLLSAGVDVRAHQRVRYDVDHAKYLVADGTWTVVLSENAAGRGWAPSTIGNRGWGVAVRDAALAGWMTDLFEGDHLHPLDSAAASPDLFSDDPVVARTGTRTPPGAPRAPPLVVAGPVRVMPVVAPDHLGVQENPIVSAIDGARDEVWTQQLNLPLAWSRSGYSTDSPLAIALVEAADRGVAVRGTLAAAFEDGDVMTDGNDRTAAALSARSDHIDLRLGEAPYGEGIVHNKGWLIDPLPGGRNLVVVGSANGNLASMALNREVDLFLEHEAIAAFFRGALASDWEVATHARALPGTIADDPRATTPSVAAVPLVALLVFVALSCARGVPVRTLHEAPGRRPGQP